MPQTASLIFPQQPPTPPPGCVWHLLGASPLMEVTMACDVDMLNSELPCPPFQPIFGMLAVAAGCLTCCMHGPVAKMPMATIGIILLDVAAATAPYGLPPLNGL